MAKFIYQEIGGITRNGERIVKPRFVGGRQVPTEEFILELTHRCGLSKGTLQAALTTISELLPEYMAQGNSVRLNGLGLFTPTLTMRDDLPVSELNGEGDEVMHNAQNVLFDTIRISPDKELVKASALKCKLTHDRYAGNSRAMETPYSKEERIALALDYLEEHPMLTVSCYMELTGLRHTMAARELRDLSDGDGAPLKSQGKGSHRYYTK